MSGYFSRTGVLLSAMNSATLLLAFTSSMTTLDSFLTFVPMAIGRLTARHGPMWVILPLWTLGLMVFLDFPKAFGSGPDWMLREAVMFLITSRSDLRGVVSLSHRRHRILSGVLARA